MVYIKNETGSDLVIRTTFINNRGEETDNTAWQTLTPDHHIEVSGVNTVLSVYPGHLQMPEELEKAKAENIEKALTEKILAMENVVFESTKEPKKKRSPHVKLGAEFWEKILKEYAAIPEGKRPYISKFLEDKLHYSSGVYIKKFAGMLKEMGIKAKHTQRNKTA